MWANGIQRQQREFPAEHWYTQILSRPPNNPEILRNTRPHRNRRANSDYTKLRTLYWLTIAHRRCLSSKTLYASGNPRFFSTCVNVCGCPINRTETQWSFIASMEHIPRSRGIPKKKSHGDGHYESIANALRNWSAFVCDTDFRNRLECWLVGCDHRSEIGR